MNKLITFIKTNKLVYIIYNRLGSLFLKFVGLFVNIDPKLVLFNSFGGKKFDDSPKVIYDYMKSNPKYADFKLVWALDEPKIVDGLGVDFVKNNTFSFFIMALKAKYWITNSSLERGLKFKKKDTLYINTWHGSSIKKLDEKNDRMAFRVTPIDIFYVQSEIDVENFSTNWNLPKDRIVKCGYPRNDELCNVTNDEIEDIKKKLNIPLDKKVIIYAPTFRDYDYDSNGCYIAPPLNLDKWREKLSKDYILLFRAHYEITNSLDIVDDDFIRDYSNYSPLNDLLKISDILISDYSSIMIDYSILERPFYCFAYDYDEYEEKRGFVYDLKTELPNGVMKTEDEIINAILNCDYDEQMHKTKKFKSTHVEVCGNATYYIDNIIK